MQGDVTFRQVAITTLLVCAACSGGHHSNADAGMIQDGGGSDGGVYMDAGPVPDNHRPAATTCSPRLSVVPDGGFPDGSGLCSFDTDCADGGPGTLDGVCVQNPLSKSTFCVFDFCESDSLCDGGVCQCTDPARGDGNACLPGNCRIDSDCGVGGFCSPNPGGCGLQIGFDAYYCHTPHDQCLSDSDCITGLVCQFDSMTTMRWICGPEDCAG